MDSSELSSLAILSELGQALGENFARPDELTIEPVRDLTEAESRELRPARTKQPDLRVLRQSHHQLARHLAQGRSPSEAALITGYTLGAIANLCENEVFKSLIASYKITEELVERDLGTQRALLEFTTLAKLQRVLEDEPEGELKNFTIGQLHDQLKALAAMNKGPGGAAGAGGGGSFAPSVNVSFVQPAPLREAGAIETTWTEGAAK